MFEIIALYSNFDVIFEVTCVLLRKKQRFEKALPFVPACHIRTFDVRSKVKSKLRFTMRRGRVSKNSFPCDPVLFY